MSDRLLHTKVSKKKPLTHFPNKKDGHDGDMQIVSIQGKGTYLCIKDKSEWKISEKFNPRNKFDTHIFDEITTRKIKGISGVVMTLSGQTTTLSDGNSYTRTMAEFGTGETAGILSSRGNQDLILKTGNSSTSHLQIIDGASGDVKTFLDTNASFDVRCGRTASHPLGLFRNDNTSGTADAFLQVKTLSTDGDVYINLGYQPGETSWKQWSIGMDANDSDAFKILGEFNDTTKLSIDDTSVDASFKIDTSGNATISGTLTSSAGVCGGPKVTNYITNDANDTMAGTLAITSTTADQFKVLYDANNYALLNVSATGDLEIETVGAGTTDSDITLNADGDILMDAAGGDVTITSADVSIAATKKLFLDGGGDTYIYEQSADNLRIIVGDDIMMHMSESGTDGNNVYFASACATFKQLTPTYNLTDTLVDFRFSNKQLVTFGPGNITNLNLYFPANSGNFVCLIKQDGTGSRTITNYKVRESDGSLADGESSVKFAGGSNPTLTTDANHVDILSFYWDSDNEIAYGVATLDFQF